MQSILQLARSHCGCHYDCVFIFEHLLMYTNSRPVTRGGAQRGESPTRKMFVPLEECVGHSFKIFVVIQKIRVPHGKLFAPSWSPKLVTGLTNTRLIEAE